MLSIYGDGHDSCFITKDNFDFIKLLQDRKSANAVHEKGFNFDDARLMRGAWRNEPNPDTCKVDCLI